MLKTKRLILRGPEPRDLDQVFATYRNPDAMRYWSTVPHENRDVTAELLARVTESWHQNQRNFQIEMDGIWIGNAGMFRDFEIGYMVAPDHWRKGIVTEALTAIIPHLFETFQVPYMTADADPNNTASCGVLEKLGFHETHRVTNTFCINDVWSDSVYYRLDPPKTFS